jgi:Fe-S-cluster containining protein
MSATNGRNIKTVLENEDLITGNVKITIGGRPIAIELTVPVKPVKSRRMLPVFQGMSELFVELGEKEVAAAGEKISCRKGCAACCRQLVPLAEIETHHIAGLVESMPEPRRSEIKERFEKAWQHFTKNGWLDRLDASAAATHKERQSLVVEYFHESVPCPFLEDESCSIHENRPLACREYLVTSPAEYCFTLSGEKIKKVSLLANPSETVRQITNSENLNRIVNFVPLVLALEWAKRFPDESPENTGEQWMAKFFTRLTKSEIPES